MAIIKPFRAIRPKSRFAGAVVAPPYDTVSIEEARKIIHKNPLSFLRTLRPETIVSFYGHSKEIVYKEAQKELFDFINREIFVQDKIPHLYIYTEQQGRHTQRGIVGLFSCRGYGNGTIKGTEKTRREELEDRIRWVKSTNVQSGPVFLMYKERRTVTQVIEKVIKNIPEYDFFTEDGVRHIIHSISDKRIILEIQNIFSKISPLYIADGNHRTRAFCTVNKGEGYFIAAAVSHMEVQILPYNRGLKSLNNLSDEEFLKKLRKFFHVAQCKATREPYAKGDFALFLKNHCFYLTLKSKKNLPDVSLLEDYVFKNILHIQNKNIKYISGKTNTDDLTEWVNNEKYKAVFLLYPPSPSEIFYFIDSGQLMPPKSMWFEPKFRSGLFLNPLKEILKTKQKLKDKLEEDLGIWI